MPLQLITPCWKQVRCRRCTRMYIRDRTHAHKRCHAASRNFIPQLLTYYAICAILCIRVYMYFVEYLCMCIPNNYLINAVLRMRIVVAIKISLSVQLWWASPSAADGIHALPSSVVSKVEVPWDLLKAFAGDPGRDGAVQLRVHGPIILYLRQAIHSHHYHEPETLPGWSLMLLLCV